jgi:tetratricopeptide (TPR) repeat protein
MDWLASAAFNNSYVDSTTSLLDGGLDASSIFTALTSQQNGMEELSNQFLRSGIDKYLNEKYEEAAKDFEAAVNLAPNSTYNVESSQYLVQTYLRLEETDKAIDTYLAAIQRNPDNDALRSALGQIYYAEGRYEESAEQYGEAFRVNPSTTNRYSYGEALLSVENYNEAQQHFSMVRRLDPESYAGDYGLGKLYAKQEDFDKAIDHFEQAFKLDPDFHDALAQIGYAYADKGEIEKAREVQEDLAELDEDLALTLEYYVDEREPPRIAFAFANSSFPYNMSKGYPVSAIDSYLENAGAEKSQTMQFLFTKDMDRASIENRFNWSISRAQDANIANTYNFGDTIPSTEVELDPFPDYVVYDSDTYTATIGFRIRQNETADGTIDPSHIVFKFDGEDIYGVSMDPDGDEFSGFSKSA